MRKKRRTRILRRFVLGLAVAAFVAPSAQARVDDIGTGTQRGDVVEQPTLPSGDAAIVPGHDDKVIVPSGGASTAVVPGHDDKVIVPAPVDAVHSPSAFDWGDAFVGAGGAVALMLLAGGVVFGTRRRVRPAAA
jgi:hypothetical protein